ncbi:hypothetical protein OX284_007540 [Flavobacterium sp. SUN046]|uniref:hypothetical protein n=1 Tax=Flavobacterium sp. SUN046 TaxID=3002440 RepID=UPI002DBD761D|nr:hypothetical protein [Flavobacterium sp. SUN046]MEC4049279.1 hypothetical protein [Flavobacterium sp. SUN046]
MNAQVQLLKVIRTLLPKETSLNDEISKILDISYDAAHRRISMKSKFSIEETVLLCNHFGISMDMLFSNQHKVLFSKTKEVQSLEDLTLYFKDSVSYIKEFKNTNATMYYSAKDIPLFYTIGGTLLSKFKLYVWLNLLIGKDNITPFESFQLTQQLQEYTSELQSIYNDLSIHEIWNDTTINSSIQQIFYFFESGLLNIDNALYLYEDVKNILKVLEDKCSKNTSQYHLYYNELLILNNSVLISKEEKKKLFLPYTMLGYFITDDAQTTTNASSYFLHQIKNSKSLNLSGTRDRKLFFNKAYQKIDYYIQKVNNHFSIEF